MRIPVISPTIVTNINAATTTMTHFTMVDIGFFISGTPPKLMYTLILSAKIRSANAKQSKAEAELMDPLPQEEGAMEDRGSISPADNNQQASDLVRIEELKLEQMKTQERIEKNKQDAQEKKDRARKKSANAAKREKAIRKASKIPIKSLAIAIACIVAVAFLFAAFVLPMLQPKSEARIVTTTELENVVRINEISTVEHVYSGIVEKPGWFLDFGMYRVKYTAHVRASFDMSQITFEEDAENKKFIVHLPEPTIGEPDIDASSFGFLPEDANGDITDVIKMCQEDARSEIQSETNIREKSLENLISTIEALTKPLVDSTGYHLSWIMPSGTPGASSDEAEDETPSENSDEEVFDEK